MAASFLAYHDFWSYHEYWYIYHYPNPKDHEMPMPDMQDWHFIVSAFTWFDSLIKLKRTSWQLSY